MKKNRLQYFEFGLQYLVQPLGVNPTYSTFKLQEDTHLYQQSNQSAVRKTKPGLHASIDPGPQDTPKTHGEK